mmetsp:Transcript_28007/g.74063  ORF Transcript_28007/g.74063 Transcript_28007/m.74063 type:complete len:211 (+) Transcript_28007:1581-2213(+)
MASAMRRAAIRSVVSPYSCTTRTISSRSVACSHSHAVSPLVLSKRRSSGPSASGRKPRCASSNCGDEMPRSKKAPCSRLCDAGPLARMGPITFAIDEKGAWWMVKRGSAFISSLPAAMASGSMSKACSRPFGLSASRMPREWPPRPNVPSTKTPLASEPTTLATHCFSIAGVCVPAACSDGRMPVWNALPAVMLRVRPPKAQPVQLSASA